MADAPVPAPVSTVSMVSTAIGAASALSGSLGRYVLAAIAGMVVVAGLLGALAIRDWHGAIAEAATATCRLADLRASETARAALQSRLDATGATISDMARDLTDAEGRRAAAVAALKGAASDRLCPKIDLRPLKKS